MTAEGPAVTETFRAVSGRQVVSRHSAERLGEVSHLLIDADSPRVAAVVIGRGKKARLVDWSQVRGVGPDAVVVHDEGALHPAWSDREQAAAAGKLELVGKRVLTERGTEVGAVADVTFDPETGTVVSLSIDGREIPGAAVVGTGSYAVVVDASHNLGAWWTVR